MCVHGHVLNVCTWSVHTPKHGWGDSDKRRRSLGQTLVLAFPPYILPPCSATSVHCEWVCATFHMMPRPREGRWQVLR